MEHHESCWKPAAVGKVCTTTGAWLQQRHALVFLRWTSIPKTGVPVATTAGKESQYPCCLKMSISTQETCKIHLYSGAADILCYQLTSFAPLSCPFLFQVFFPPLSSFPPPAPSPPVNMLHLISCCDTISGT